MPSPSSFQEEQPATKLGELYLLRLGITDVHAPVRFSLQRYLTLYTTGG